MTTGPQPGLLHMSNVEFPMQAFGLTGACIMQGFQGSLHRATVKSAMQGAGNSGTCLAARTCLPLGGHSVWAALPPPPR